MQRAVAELLGSPVASAVNEPGGFSPGLAARCGLADGRRCFVKAVSADQNPDSPAMHRREALVARALPPGLPVPAFLGATEEAGWVVLAFEEVEGRPPALPWTMAALASTLGALAEVAVATTPCPVPGLGTFAEAHGPAFSGFRTLAGGHPAVALVDGWTRRHLDRLAELESGCDAATSGSALLHADLRADNLLVRPDGTVVVVDWPHACVGAAWVDVVCMLPSVGLGGGPLPGDVEAALGPFAGVEPEAVDRVLAGLAGYFTFQGALPDPPGIPTVRPFQRAQGEVARAWLAARLRSRRGGWSGDLT